jgi:crotonobetainyl-CoA:carnitine CoA-transferase CaiB-like acyl-CoA transferase
LKPLDKVRVIEVGQIISAPICGIQLALLGAEVIKIERPEGGDEFRYYGDSVGVPGISTSYAAYNAGKKSVVLDLHAEAGREAFTELIANADVVIENLRHGAMERLGLGWDDLRQVNPRLVYCSISGFGQTGRLADLPAYDHILQAMSGLMALNGTPDEPSRIPVPMVDIMAGTQAALAVLAALVRRDTEGIGQRIDVALLDSALFFMGTQLASYAQTGVVEARQGNLGFRPTATSGVYPTRDGHITIGCNQQSQFERLCAALDFSELLADEQFATHEARMRNRELLRDILTEKFGQLNAVDIERRCAAVNVPAVKVRNIGELMREGYPRERGVVADVAVEGADPMTIVGPLFQCETDGPSADGPVERLGTSTSAVLAELTGGPVTGHGQQDASVQITQHSEVD